MELDSEIYLMSASICSRGIFLAREMVEMESGAYVKPVD